MNRFARMLSTLLVSTALLIAPAAHAGPWSALYVFGDSLSDSGNNALLLDGIFGVRLRTPVPIPDNGFVPVAPYESDRYSDNSFVWVDAFAAELGLTNNPSMSGGNLADGSNLAFGGARTGPFNGGIPFSLIDQVATFLIASNGNAPSSALYVVAGGGNDLRDAAEIAAAGGNAIPTIEAYVSNTIAILATLEAAGARDILLWNVPDLGLSPAAAVGGPAAQFGATLIAALMNAAVDNALALLPNVAAGVRVFDVFGLMQDIAQDPAYFGLSNVTDACAADLATCTDPGAYLFWDGVHPTAAGHMLLARGALAAIPEPATTWLVAAAGLALLRRRPVAARDAPGIKDSARS